MTREEYLALAMERYEELEELLSKQYLSNGLQKIQDKMQPQNAPTQVV